MGLTPTDTDQGRTYTWGDDVYASVTTILGVLNKPALPRWAANAAAKFAVDNQNTIAQLIEQGQWRAAVDLIKGAPWRQRDKAAEVGTLVHHMIDNLHTGIEVEIPAEALQQVTHFVNWVEHFKPKILVSEGTIFNRVYDYAGTLDIVAHIDGLNWLIDIKSGKGVYPEYAMQVAAYSRGEFIGHEDGSEQVMPIIDKGAVLHIRPEGYHFVPVNIGKEVFDSFLYCRELFRWQDEISHRALLPEVRR
jgi:hypothetical protein